MWTTELWNMFQITEGSGLGFKQDQNFKIKTDFTSSFENLIYTITCSGCSMNYIRSTETSFRRKTILHREQIYGPQYIDFLKGTH